MRTMGRRYASNLTTVNALITADRKWNVPLIENLFFAPDAQAILRIPLAQVSGDDWVAWSKEESGIYSVRSGYRALMDHMLMN